MMRPSPSLARKLRSICGLAIAWWLAGVSLATAQSNPKHYQHFGDLPPGAVGRMQLERGGPLQGYFQPVEVQGPEGSEVSLWDGDECVKFNGHRAKAGMLVGEVYQARVTRIPNRAGFEVYPTVELINRLYPPPGQEVRFPIPVQITEEDIDRALKGQFVVRVVYLEDPLIALPVQQRDGQQRVVDIGPGEDPLVAADKLGRPMAIVRIGSRVPDQLLQGFPGQPGPPLQRYRVANPADASPETANAAASPASDRWR